MSVLQEICNVKKEHVTRQKNKMPLSSLEDKIRGCPSPRGFINAIKTQTQTAIIAEIKKASPSKGIIRANFNHTEIAKTYERSGATCLSVLTDEPYFQGHDSYLRDIKSCTTLPLLRKDFIIDPYQIYESRVLGADCILLIMAALSDTQAKELYDLATALNMDVLIEVHDLEELIRAKALNPKMIGINNRNLKTLKVDIRTSWQLIGELPDEAIKIAESGLSDRETLRNLKNLGYNGFLIGESLMRQNNIGNTLKALIA